MVLMWNCPLPASGRGQGSCDQKARELCTFLPGTPSNAEWLWWANPQLCTKEPTLRNGTLRGIRAKAEQMKRCGEALTQEAAQLHQCLSWLFLIKVGLEPQCSVFGMKQMVLHRPIRCQVLLAGFRSSQIKEPSFSWCCAAWSLLYRESLSLLSGQQATKRRDAC